MKLSLVKSLVLAALVGLSVVLSALLWRGMWQNTTELSLTVAPTLPTAASPVQRQATAPYEVVVNDGESTRFYIAHLGDTAYEYWLRMLHGVQLGEGRTVNDSSPAVRSASFDFGTRLSSPMLAQWVPALAASTEASASNQVRLFQMERGGTVWLDVMLDTGWWQATTDLSSRQFEQLIHAAASGPAWTSAVGSGPAQGQLLPVNGLTMAQMDWKLATPSVMPLLRSFFVNPLALTRIRENSHMLIWTDGSRVVWWDSQLGTLTYQDPTTTLNALAPQPTLPIVLNFVRNHGGSASGVVAFHQADATQYSDVLDFQLQVYASGYPVFDPLGLYDIALQSNRVTDYRRPFSQLSAQVKQTSVHTLDANRVLKKIQALMPQTSLSQLTIQLGYYVLPLGNGLVRLKPGVRVDASGVPLFMMDAVTGKMIKGWGLQ